MNGVALQYQSLPLYRSGAVSQTISDAAFDPYVQHLERGGGSLNGRLAVWTGNGGLESAFTSGGGGLGWMG